MLYLASSFPSDFVKARTPAFEELYALALALPSLPETDEIFTILPYLFLIIWGTIDLQQLNVPFKLISIIFFQSFILYFQSCVVGPVIPALLIKISIFDFFVIFFTALTTLE